MTTEVAEKESNRKDLVRNVLGGTVGLLAIVVIALIVILVAGGSAAVAGNKDSEVLDKVFLSSPIMPAAIATADNKVAADFATNLKVWEPLERLSLDKIVSRSDAKLAESREQLLALEFKKDFVTTIGEGEFLKQISYSGSVKDGKMYGVGRYIDNNGWIYEGQFQDSKFVGYGRYTATTGVYYITQYDAAGAWASQKEYDAQGVLVVKPPAE